MVERRDDLTADDILGSMLADSVGRDQPMTPEALDSATVEVGARIQAAQDMVHMPTGGEIDPDAVDTEAMMAAFLLWQESK